MSDLTLHGVGYSPWTERARWALDHHRIPYRYREHIPMVGEPLLRRRAHGTLRVKATAPLLVHAGGAIDDSLAIMRYADAIWRPSSCFTAGNGRKPTFVVLHITDGAPSVKNSAERFAASKAGVSPHFLIGQGGEIYQFVQLEDIAWHAKGWNSNSIDRKSVV